MCYLFKKTWSNKLNSGFKKFLKSDSNHPKKSFFTDRIILSEFHSYFLVSFNCQMLLYDINI